MLTLAITIQVKNDTDFDGNAYSYKLATATHTDGDTDIVNIIYHSEESTVSDADVILNVKAKLTALGYEWYNEI